MRPKIGLALSGASGRAIAHAGVLDVLTENNIPVDYIASCSSAAIIAAAYATGTLPELKHEIFTRLTQKDFLNLISPSDNSSGLFSLNPARERLSKYTKGLNIEHVRPHLAFATVDLNTGEEVPISMGDMLNGIVASCSVPGLFEPIKWGNKTLADGGLVNLVPAEMVKSMGADIVISVDIAATKYMFTEKSLKIFKNLVFLIQTSKIPYNYLKKLFTYVKNNLGVGNYIQFYSQSDVLDESEKLPDIVQVVAKVIEISRSQGKNPYEKFSDVILLPDVKHLGKTDFKSSRLAYEEGRRATLATLPHIKKLLGAPAKEPLRIKKLTKRLSTQSPSE